MHLGAQRTRSGIISPPVKTNSLLFLLTVCLTAGIAQGHSQGIDILQRLGFTENNGQRLSSSPTQPWPSLSLPQGVLMTELGIMLSSEAHIETQAESIVPLDIGSEFTIIASLRSHRVNNAFLFSIRNKNRIQFGVQILPRKLVVYIAEKPSVYFDYNAHDGQWHSFAIEIKGKTASFSADCGKKHFSKELLKKPQKFVSNSKLVLGRMNFKSAPFEGVICQLDIYPNAQASTNYCNYVKKQCRRADTYRSQSPSLTTASYKDTSSRSQLTSSPFSEGTQPTSSSLISLYVNPEEQQKIQDTTMYLNQSLTSTTEPNAVTSSPEPRISFTSAPTTTLPTPNITDPMQLHQTLNTDIESRVVGAVTGQPNVSFNLGNAEESPVEQKTKENQSDNATEGDRGGKLLSVVRELPPLTSLVKQSKITESLNKRNQSGIIKQKSDELMEIQMINATLYRSSQETSSKNQFDLWDENIHSNEDTEHNMEKPYDIDIESYDYDYEDFTDLFDYEDLKGSKGEPG
uniref:Thrombospondin-like N-terminal domain-containing protein n=3 Tax=Callorhinchus milii TaxID=7868 RepID=A0A4W3HJN1_CALMI